MTSGVAGNIAIIAQNWLGTDSYKQWSGGNGRFEMSPAGKQRSRWNNYSVVKLYRRKTKAGFTLHGDGNHPGTTVYSSSMKSVSPGTPYQANLEITAQSRLIDAIRGHGFNLAVNAAQSRQLVDMVVGNLGKLGRAALALRRGDFATAARQLGASPRPSRLKPNDIGGRWLELQYGWLPALSDTWEAAKAYEKLTKWERNHTVSASASATVVVDDSEDEQFYSAKTLNKQRVRWVYELSEVLEASRSLGLLDPLSVAWEIIPYSFVVDWFIPIGTFLDNLSIAPHLKGRWIMVKSQEFHELGPPFYTGALPTGRFGGVVNSVVYEGVDLRRGLISTRTTGHDAVPLALPQFDASGLHGNRIWNAIALATQRFLR